MTISVVTGANSGIGRAIAIHLAAQGHVVYGTVRNVDKAGKLLAMAADSRVEVNLVEMDVADDASVGDGFITLRSSTTILWCCASAPWLTSRQSTPSAAG